MNYKLQQRFLFRHWLIIAILILECGSFYSCSQYDLDNRLPSWLGSSIYQYLNDEGKYTNFQSLIDDLKQKDVLANTGSKTLFVADDDAFNRFYAHNSWGVKNYSDLSISQKSLLLNGAMINNVYPTSLLSSTEGPKIGDCMRRLTAVSIYDSVPRILPAEMPNTSNWAFYKNKPEGILCLKDMTAPPMIHFMEKMLALSNITQSDYSFLFNNTVDRKPGDANVNGIVIEEKDIKCLNGFVHKMSDVVIPLNNMAEIIRQKPSSSVYSSLLERYSAPYPNLVAKIDYNYVLETRGLPKLRPYPEDTVYQKRYFSERSQVADPLYVTPGGKPATGILKFDPGWNGFFSSTVSSVSNNVALEENMGVMLVPTNEALNRYWNEGGGKILKSYYGTWENVPDYVLVRLINNNMLNSFLNSVPSKFSNVLNDANNEMGLKPSDVDSVYLGCNGAVYMTNKVFTPTQYASVSFPSLVNQNMNIFFWAIEQLKYEPYLNSMDSYYSFFIPTNEALTRYIDPVTYGKTVTFLYKFYYDPKAISKASRVQASVWAYDLTTGTTIGDSLGMASSTWILDRLKDMLDNHIVIGNVEDGNTYYQTKSGGTLKISNAAGGEGKMTVSGGFQIENGKTLTVREIYDESVDGNGKTYILKSDLSSNDLSEPLMTSKNSVYDILNKHEEFSAFLELLKGDPNILETVHNKTYACGSMNISLFDTYHYTVYVPTNKSIQDLQVQDNANPYGKLPNWAQIDTLKSETVRDIAVKDSLKKVINNFLKYHIQDNSIFIGSGDSKGNYETALVNTETKRFYRLGVTATNNGISITDGAGIIHSVTDNTNLRNLMAREYQFDNKDIQRSSMIETSAFAVVHQIEQPLMYSSTQFGSMSKVKTKKK